MNTATPSPISPAAHVPAVLVGLLQQQPQLVFSVLIGSRATGNTHTASDWDIALQWEPQASWVWTLAQTETLRAQLAQALHVAPQAIDLIDLRRANLAMRAAVAEEGLPLTGTESLAWMHFLQRTWHELEAHYWKLQHAA
ncbi:MAG: hypothetical protein RLZZ352_2233 [Pseudomonadota bacterium]|jgi:predicted nucleotidyltransferase